MLAKEVGELLMSWVPTYLKQVTAFPLEAWAGLKTAFQTKAWAALQPRTTLPTTAGVCTPAPRLYSSAATRLLSREPARGWRPSGICLERGGRGKRRTAVQC